MGDEFKHSGTSKSTNGILLVRGMLNSFRRAIAYDRVTSLENKCDKKTNFNFILPYYSVLLTL